MLEGKDIVARARTGSGKTLAYLLPALHKVLTAGRGRVGWQALVLVPTRELCEQVKPLQSFMSETRAIGSKRPMPRPQRTVFRRSAAWPGCREPRGGKPAP